MPNRVVIMSGVSGSGKSTLLREFAPTVIVSADHYFETADGYFFNTWQLSEAHNSCVRDFIAACERNKEASDLLIGVDNTNTEVAEIAPYVAIGNAFGYAVEIVTIRADADELEKMAKRNKHGTPLDAIVRQWARLVVRVLPPRWKNTYRPVEGVR